MKSQHQQDTPLDNLMGFVTSAGQILMYLGLAFFALSSGVLIYYLYVFSDAKTADDVTKALAMIGNFDKGLLIGVLGFGFGSCMMMWGENRLAVFHGVAAAFLLGLPFLAPIIFGSTGRPEVISKIYVIFQQNGAIMAAIATVTIIVTLVTEVKNRSSQGFKADQLKFGKGVKVEAADRQNVWMGKCWQLPYCRKFVRERCPIYHAKRTCWRERVGCMCEESVIQDAMQGKIIPRDVVAAGRMIPHNNKLTMSQKVTRCKQCVIYNEHQKHKYKAAVPASVAGFAILLVAGWGILNDMVVAILGKLDTAMGQVALTGQKGLVSKALGESQVPFIGLLVICLVLMAFAYFMKLLEYLFFKVKI